jgi:hypothetical protein
MDELRPGNPIVAGEVTIVPIERCHLLSIPGDIGCCLSGVKEPFAIIIFDVTGIRAYDMAALEISVVSLIQKIPDLSTVLASLTQQQGRPEEFSGKSV